MLFQHLENTIKALKAEIISNERKRILQPLIDYIQFNTEQGKNSNLNFICTHNSRRSHLSQVWAQAAAFYFNVKGVFCYSGGTEATALFPAVAITLKDAGFQLNKLSKRDNVIYSIKYAENEQPIIGFSKTFDHQFNPQSDFAAVMTCSHANENCPFIPGAAQRIPIEYQDPKEFDNSPQQLIKYKERSNQIAAEMLYVFSQIKRIK